MKKKKSSKSLKNTRRDISTFKFVILFGLFSVLFYFIWKSNIDFYFMKKLTAFLVAKIANAKYSCELSNCLVYLKNSIVIIVRDCTAWKEMFLFSAFLLSYEFNLQYFIFGLFLIYIANLLRLIILLYFNTSLTHKITNFIPLAISLILILKYLNKRK